MMTEQTDERESTDNPNDGTPDIRWFGLHDVMLLEAKLAAHPMFATYLQDQNDYLREQSKAPLTLRDVALVGCVYRKNIRQNADDPGAVPQRAMEQFSRNSTLAKKAMCRLQVRAALEVLSGVQFLVQARPANRKSPQPKGRCAAFKLLNETQWEAPITPTTNRDGDPNGNENENVSDLL